MLTDELAKVLEMLSSSSFMWGPFFFSLLFMLVITRTANNYFQNVIKRTDPPADKEEKQVYRRFFVASIIAGIVLVFVSVGWWTYAQMQLHAFEGVIVGLRSDQFITAMEDDVYLREVQRDGGLGNKMRDYHFAIVRDSAFSVGQTFRFSFYPEPGNIGSTPPKPIDLEVPYSGKISGKFMLKREGDSFTLTRLSQ
jgi:hypothetical protein